MRRWQLWIIPLFIGLTLLAAEIAIPLVGKTAAIIVFLFGAALTAVVVAKYKYWPWT